MVYTSSDWMIHTVCHWAADIANRGWFGVYGYMIQALTSMIQNHGGTLEFRKSRRGVGAMTEATSMAMACIQVTDQQCYLFNWRHIVSTPMVVHETCLWLSQPKVVTTLA